MAYVAPTSPAVGDQVAASIADTLAADIIYLAATVGAYQTLLFTPGGTLSTPLSGTATWMTLGNITVPAWSTSCTVSYAVVGAFETGSASNANVVLKIGSVSGAVNKRVLAPSTLSTRFAYPVNDKLTGLTVGLQSVTLAATWNAASALNVDALSFVTAQFLFQP